MRAAVFAPGSTTERRCSVARSRPNGKLLATAAVDGAIRIWELPSGRLVNVMLGASKLRHRRRVHQRRSSSRQREPRRNRRARGTCRDGKLLGHASLATVGAIRSVSTTPDGRRADDESGDGPRSPVAGRTADPRRFAGARDTATVALRQTSRRPLRESGPTRGRPELLSIATPVARGRLVLRLSSGLRSPPTGLELEGKRRSGTNGAAAAIVLRGHTGRGDRRRDVSRDRLRDRDSEPAMTMPASGTLRTGNRLLHVLSGHFGDRQRRIVQPGRTAGS